MTARSTAPLQPWLLLLLVAGLMSVASLFERGAYADDFLFLHYLSTRSVLAGFTEWHFNSRWTQAALIPLLYQPALSTDGLGGWWPVHGLALLALVAIAIATERSLALTGFSTRTRALLVGLFLIHPGKAQAVLWVATIIGYVLPAAWVALAFWYHLHIAATQRENLLRLVPILLAYASACLSLEQFVPYCSLLVLLRLLAFPATLATWGKNAGLLAGMAVLFLGATIAGSTGDRLAHHGGMGLGSMLATLLEIVQGTLETTVIGTLRVWLDPDLRHLLLPALTSWLSLIGVGAFLAAFALIPPSRVEPRNSYRLLLLGLAIWFAPLSPLLVIDYYTPERVFFLSLIGLGMLVVYALELLLDLLPSKTLQCACIALLAIPLFVASRVRDAQFVQQWAYTRTLIENLAHTPTQGSEPMLVVAGFPRAIDPVPDVLYGRILDGLAATALQQADASGRADPDLDFTIPDLCSEPTSTLQREVLPGHHLWVWSHQGPTSLTGLQYSSDVAATGQAGLSAAEWQAQAFRQSYAEGITLSVPAIIRLPKQDALMVCVSVDWPEDSPTASRELRLTAHATSTAGGGRVYDRNLTEKDNMFRRHGTQWQRVFLVTDASQLGALELGLSGAGKVLEGPTQLALLKP